jgi:hypothetical protein
LATGGNPDLYRLVHVINWGLALSSGTTCAMKSCIARFVTDQSGAVDFDNGFTVFVMIIGFIAALALMNATYVQLYAAVSGVLPGYH